VFNVRNSIDEKTSEDGSVVNMESPAIRKSIVQSHDWAARQRALPPVEKRRRENMA
jgi:hypothetical protein